jgi:hypothetical protein
MQAQSTNEPTGYLRGASGRAAPAAPEEVRLQIERWINEGGSFDLEAIQPPAAGVAGA